MLKGAVRTIGKPIEGLKQTRVSIDGSWQKPEHVSPNGIVLTLKFSPSTAVVVKYGRIRKECGLPMLAC